MIRHHPIGHISIILLRILLSELASVRSTSSDRLDSSKERREDIGVVVRALLLQNRGQTLEPHTRVDMFVRKESELARGLAVELDEDQVPDLNHVRVVGVHQGRSVASSDAVEVHLGAGTTWPCISHLPEVGFLVEGKNSLGREELEPEVSCLGIAGKSLCLVASEVRRVEPLLWKLEQRK